MIARCINDRSEKHPNYLSKLTSNKLSELTKDKSYEVEQSKEYEGYFDVMNDLGIKESYKKERFETMEDKTKYCNNEECGSNQKGTCTFFQAGRYCDDEIKIEKENHCYNKKCQDNDQNGYCLNRNIECGLRMQKLPVFYEEQYKKLKEENKNLEIKFEKHLSYIDSLKKENEELKAENEDLKERLDNQAESIGSYIKENEKYRDYIKDSNKIFDKLTKEKELLECQLENEFSRNHVVMKKNEELERENLGLKDKLETIDNKYQEENEELKAEINQLRDKVQQSEFEIKKYTASEIGYKKIIIGLTEAIKELTKNIYVEGLED